MLWFVTTNSIYCSLNVILADFVIVCDVVLGYIVAGEEPKAWIVACESREPRERLSPDLTVNMNLLFFLYSFQTFRLNTARVLRTIAKIRTVLKSKLLTSVRFLYRTGKSGVYAAFVRVNIKQVPNINNVLKAGYTG